MLIAGVSTQCEREGNPLLSEYNTPFNVPPFHRIRVEHFEPAVVEGMKRHKAEVEAILSNAEAPTFGNTIEALEYSGELLTNVLTVFYNLTWANTSPELQELSQRLAPLISRHNDDIYLNPILFQRVKAVHEAKDELKLNPEQDMLLTKRYRGFVRGGANLPEEKQARFREINEKLSKLTLQYGDNVLAETNSFQLIVDNEKDLAGLPTAQVEAAAQSAKNAGLEGKWLFTLQKPSLIPFLQYAENRALRERIYRGYFMRGDNGNERDNKAIVNEIVNLRIERAQLLGYPTHSHFVLEESMAKNPEGVLDLLDQLWSPALRMAKKEASDMQGMIASGGGSYPLASWDWWYYTEKIRLERFNLDEEMLKPYFSLQTVTNGVFLLTEKLFGLKFKQLADVPVYHPDVEVYEVLEANGQHVGLLYMDFHPRGSKHGGAWMTSYRKQSIRRNGEFVTPVISIVCNFTRPTADSPALLSIEEVITYFHEFGHALHGLLSKTTYPSLSGTSVPRDFVELPSQLMEHWSTDPKFLKIYALHHQTHEPIPDELIAKMQASNTFNQGFITGEYLAAAYLDMDFHTLKEQVELDVNEFERISMQRIGLIDEIIPRYRSTYFNHIFSGGYSSGYYSYIWSGVLDSDAYEAFRETGNIFDGETAARFRREILERGGTVDPMEQYVNFRGAKPQIEPLLRKRGLI